MPAMPPRRHMRGRGRLPEQRVHGRELRAPDTRAVDVALAFAEFESELVPKLVSFCVTQHEPKHEPVDKSKRKPE